MAHGSHICIHTHNLKTRVNTSHCLELLKAVSKKFLSDQILFFYARRFVLLLLVVANPTRANGPALWCYIFLGGACWVWTQLLGSQQGCFL